MCIKNSLSGYHSGFSWRKIVNQAVLNDMPLKAAGSALRNSTHSDLKLICRFGTTTIVTVIIVIFMVIVILVDLNSDYQRQN